MSFFKKWSNLGLFFIYFRYFQTNNTIFTTNQCAKMSIQYTALGFDPQPFELESSPITTRPGLFYESFERKECGGRGPDGRAVAFIIRDPWFVSS